MYRLLVTGQKGQIGQAIRDRIQDQGWDVLFTDIDTLDITNAKQVQSVFKRFKPDVVVNASGYTDVDKAEYDTAAAESINAYGVYLLAIQCHNLGALFIHFSTEYIFSGHGRRAYLEDDTPTPLNVYGRTKLQGEQYIKTYLSRYIIIRTSWVFSEYGQNFVTTMLSLSRETAPIRVVNDQIGCPTYAGDLANLVVDIAKDYHAETGRYRFGDYNFCSDSDSDSDKNSGVSWFDFAYAVFEELDKYKPGEQGRRLIGVTSEEYASIATRPKNGILDCHKISLIFRPSDWRCKLRHVIAITMT
ncbi:dTDP-4-dehydrorhamnose reductase [Moritella marina]|uniref:dTDP-4-dehydrorhamnose reductase n=1 Tax=Moritella marina TaxID=90736 RepID=UPI003703F534